MGPFDVDEEIAVKHPANGRLSRLVIFAAEHGLTPEQSRNVPDMYSVVLDHPQRRRMLLMYGDKNHSVDIFLVDDDADDNYIVTLREAQQIMKEAGERRRRRAR